MVTMSDEFGDRYHVVELPDGVKLVPMAEDSLAALRHELASIDRPVNDLRDDARSAAIDEAGP